MSLHEVDPYLGICLAVIKDEKKTIKQIGKVVIITAGTSDIPVAEKARVVAQETGCETIASYDVGVAGIHSLFSHLDHMVNEEVQKILWLLEWKAPFLQWRRNGGCSRYWPAYFGGLWCRRRWFNGSLLDVAVMCTWNRCG
jgi:hypothetical protein